MGKNQENLTEVSWQCLQPYILYYMYVHVYTGSTDMYHISSYPVPIGARPQEWKHTEMKEAVA